MSPSEYTVIRDLQDQLEGVSALSIYLLQRLGGSITIDKDALVDIVATFPYLEYRFLGDEVNIRVRSTTMTSEEEMN